MNDFIHNRVMTSVRSNFRDYLKEDWAARFANNPRYSLRAYAKNLGLAPSTLSELIHGKAGLSNKRAEAIIHKLKLREEEREQFLLLVQIENTRSPLVKEALLYRSHLDTMSKNTHLLDIDVFKTFVEWQHFAILEYTYINSEATAEELAERLSLSVVQIEVAIERLLRVGLLKKHSSTYEKTNDRVLLRSSQKEVAVQRYFHGNLELIRVAIEELKPEERFSAGDFLPFSRTDLPEAEKIFERALSELIALSRKAAKRDDVFLASIHFFPVTLPKNKTKKVSRKEL